MADEVPIVVPAVGESISEVFIGEWYVEKGTWVAADTNVVGLETDKATFDVPAPEDGVLSRLECAAGDTAQVGDTIAWLTPQEKPAESESTSDSSSEPDAPASKKETAKQQSSEPEQKTRKASKDHSSSESSGGHVMPAADRMMKEHNLPPGSVRGTGPGGRVLKDDVTRHVQSGAVRVSGSRERRSVPLSPIRQTIADRLVSAQQTAALLTTFNEVDMSTIKQLREAYKKPFEEKYGAKLGFMSFFVKAVVSGLQQYPQINAQIEGRNLVFHNYCDIGIAIGGGKGLLVPILRNAENMSFADIELAILDFAGRAQKNQIELEELQGGTFTITNGGVYGSLLSTPIVNPPQSGVLGMHGIVDRPIAENGEVVIRPMMYIALTYDHRVVDGREAVSFLRHVREMAEDPTRMILEI